MSNSIAFLLGLEPSDNAPSSNDLSVALTGLESLTALLSNGVFNRQPLVRVTGDESFAVGIISLYGADLNRYNGSESFVQNVKNGLIAVIKAIINVLQEFWTWISGQKGRKEMEAFERAMQVAEDSYQDAKESWKEAVKTSKIDSKHVSEMINSAGHHRGHVKDQLRILPKEHPFYAIAEEELENIDAFINGRITAEKYFDNNIDFSRRRERILEDTNKGLQRSVSEMKKEAEKTKAKVNGLNENNQDQQSIIKDDLESIKTDVKKAEESRKAMEAIYINGKFIAKHAREIKSLAEKAKYSTVTDV